MTAQRKESTKKAYRSPQLFVYGTVDEIIQDNVDTARHGDSFADSLSGNVAQDLNRLLIVILANISLAQRYAKAGEKISVALEKAENVCLRAKELTRELIRYSR